MHRLRGSSLQRASAWLLDGHVADDMRVKILDYLQQTAGPALPQLQHAGSAAPPLSPLDHVKARIQDEDESNAAHPSGDASPQHGCTAAAQDPQGATRAATAEGAGSAAAPGSLHQSALKGTSVAEAAASAPQHWLDRHFPAARQWLQQKNIQWWLRGVQARCK